eukprot:15343392-Ditylum_brightwellii.AAC.1
MVTNKPGSLLAIHHAETGNIIEIKFKNIFMPHKPRETSKCQQEQEHGKNYKRLPSLHGGAEFIPLREVQGICQILNLLRHTRANDVMGKLVRIALSWTQHQFNDEQHIMPSTR